MIRHYGDAIQPSAQHMPVRTQAHVMRASMRDARVVIEREQAGVWLEEPHLVTTAGRTGATPALGWVGVWRTDAR